MNNKRAVFSTELQRGKQELDLACDSFNNDFVWIQKGEKQLL